MLIEPQQAHGERDHHTPHDDIHSLPMSTGRRERAGDTGSPAWSERVDVKAGRQLASQVTDDEYREMMQRHSEFIKRSYSEGLTPADERNLALLRWGIDRVRDAKSGRNLDMIERLVLVHEGLAKHIHKLADDLDDARVRAVEDASRRGKQGHGRRG